MQAGNVQHSLKLLAREEKATTTTQSHHVLDQVRHLLVVVVKYHFTGMYIV